MSIIGMMIALGVLGTLATRVPARETSCTEFKQLVRSGEVAAVVLGESRFAGRSSPMRRY